MCRAEEDDAHGAAREEEPPRGLQCAADRHLRGGRRLGGTSRLPRPQSTVSTSTCELGEISALFSYDLGHIHIGSRATCRAHSAVSTGISETARIFDQKDLLASVEPPPELAEARRTHEKAVSRYVM